MFDYASPFSTAASALRIEEPAAPITAVYQVNKHILVVHSGSMNLLL